MTTGAGSRQFTRVRRSGIPLAAPQPANAEATVSKSAVLLWLLALASLPAACTKTDPRAGHPASVAATAPTTATDAITGVAVCDQFLCAYVQCVTESVPVQARLYLLSRIDRWKSAWRDMAANQATRDSLPRICRQVGESSRAALDAYDCKL